MKKFDLIVVGGGPGGYVAAIYASQQGLKTALVEKADLGGVCLNWGCIPTKALIANSEILRAIKNASAFGISLDQTSVKPDYASAQKRSREVSSHLIKGVTGLLKKNNVTMFNGEATLTSSSTVKILSTNQTITATSVILATGAHPFKLPNIDYTNPNIMTSRDALELTDLKPNEKVIIIGAGAIGMEFASIWETYGAEVTIIEMLPHLLPNEDDDISKEIELAYKKRKIHFKTNTKVTEVTGSENNLNITIDSAGRSEILSCSKLLVSAGVRPNTNNLGLDLVGVKLNEKGWIEVNENFQTTCPNIYAVGDVNGKMALAHVASAHSMVAVDAILGRNLKQINHVNMPRCTYSYPEVASVGVTEKQAKDLGFDVKIGVFPLLANGKSIAMGETTGFVKIVADKKYNEILGIHIIGAHVTELIHAATAYLDIEVTADELSRVVHPHPTISEAIMEAAHVIVGHPIHI